MLVFEQNCVLSVSGTTTLRMTTQCCGKGQKQKGRVQKGNSKVMNV